MTMGMMVILVMEETLRSKLKIWVKLRLLQTRSKRCLQERCITLTITVVIKVLALTRRKEMSKDDVFTQAAHALVLSLVLLSLTGMEQILGYASVRGLSVLIATMQHLVMVYAFLFPIKLDSLDQSY